MKVIHQLGTEHVEIDVPALTAFLLQQKFSPAYIDAVTIILVPFEDGDDIDDETYDKLFVGDIDVLLYLYRTDITLNAQLLREIRQSWHENDQDENAPEYTEDMVIGPIDEVETADIVAFGNLDCPQFVTVGEAVLL